MKLRVSLSVNTDSDPEPEINVMPVDINIPNSAAYPLDTVIDVADLHDKKPGNQKLDTRAMLKLPIGKLGFIPKFLQPFIPKDATISVPVDVSVSVE